MTHLYFFEWTTLSEAVDAGLDFNRGDIVLLMRPLLDDVTDVAQSLRDQGVDIRFAEWMLDDKTARDIDAMIDRIFSGWYVLDGPQTATDGHFRFGQALSGQLPPTLRLPMIIRMGEIMRKMLAEMPDILEVITDFHDGDSAYNDQFPEPSVFPRRTFLNQFFAEYGIPVRTFEPSKPIPIVQNTGASWGYKNLIWHYLGGMRPQYLIPRLKAKWWRGARRRAYVFFNNGVEKVAESLSRTKNFEVFIDRSDVAGTTPLRFDHLLPIPSFGLLATGWRTARTLLKLPKALSQSGMAMLNGYDYGYVVGRIIRSALLKRMPYYVLRAAQARALVVNYGFDVVIINAEPFPVRVMRGYSVGRNVPFFDVCHGLMIYPLGYACGAGMDPNITYLTHGADTLKNFGRGKPQSERPKAINLTSPVFSSMNSVRQKWREENARNLLITNFSHNLGSTAARYFRQDRYMLEVFSVAKSLAREHGFSLFYRQHPSEPLIYADYVVKRLGMDGMVTFQNQGTFQDALRDKGVVIGNASSTTLQTLYAGYPTIFYEPEFHPEDFLGMPSATDIERPVAETPEALKALILGVLDPNSLVRRFPQDYTGQYAERFVGFSPEKAIDLITDYIVEDTALAAEAVDHG